MSSTHAPMRTTPKMKVPGPGFPWRRIGVVAFWMALLTALWWAVQFVQTHTTINIGLAGTTMSFAARPEVEKIATQKAQQLSITFKTDHKTTQPTLEQIGVSIDKRASVKTVFDGRQFSDAPASLAVWKPYNVPLVIEVDRRQLEAYIAATFPAEYQAPTQPDLKFNPSIEQFELVPGKSGRGFDVDAIVARIEAQGDNPQPLTVRPTSESVEPSVTDAAATNTQDEANRRLWLRLDLLYQQDLIYYPESSEIASWMEFAPSRDRLSLDIHYDRQKMHAFLQQKVEPSLNRYFGPGSDDADRSESPLKLTDTRALITDMVDALESKQSIAKEVDAIEESDANDVQQ